MIELTNNGKKQNDDDKKKTPRTTASSSASLSLLSSSDSFQTSSDTSTTEIDTDDSDNNSDDNHQSLIQQQQHKKENHQQQNNDTIATSKYYWVAPTIVLCSCSFSSAWLILSVFPYSAFMAIELVPGVNEENVGPYAGIIASIFMFGRACSAYAWGKLADWYGRRFVFITCLWLSIIFSILFGTCKTFYAALLYRFCLGFFNGMIATAKTAASEIAHGNEQLETKIVGIVIGMFAWGNFISPAFAGYLAEPVKQYPNSSFVKQFELTLTKHPFLLPNFVSAVLCFIVLVCVLFFLPETLPPEDLHDLKHDIIKCCIQIWEKTKQIIISNNTNAKTVSSQFQEEAPSLLSTTTNNTTDEGEENKPDKNKTLEVNNHNDNSGKAVNYVMDKKPTVSVASLWSKQITRNHLIVFWWQSFYSVGMAEALPLFLVSRLGGFGLQEAGIGNVLSGAGLVFVIAQYFVYSKLVDRFGISGSMRFAAVVSIPLVCLVPVSLIFNHGTIGSMSHGAFIYFCLVNGALRVCTMTFFAGMTISINRTVPTSQRATLNGLAMLGGSIAKALGPSLMGFLASFCMSSGIVAPHVGGYIVFLSLGLCVSISAFLTYSLLDPAAAMTIESEESQQQCDDSNEQKV